MNFLKKLRYGFVSFYMDLGHALMGVCKGFYVTFWIIPLTIVYFMIRNTFGRRRVPNYIIKTINIPDDREFKDYIYFIFDFIWYFPLMLVKVMIGEAKVPNFISNSLAKLDERIRMENIRDMERYEQLIRENYPIPEPKRAQGVDY